MPLRWWVVAARSVHVSSSAEPEASKTWRDRGELPMDVHPQHCRKLGRLKLCKRRFSFSGGLEESNATDFEYDLQRVASISASTAIMGPEDKRES